MKHPFYELPPGMDHEMAIAVWSFVFAICMAGAFLAGAAWRGSQVIGG